MSIKANELRIGNIFWEDYGGYKVVTAINCNKVGDAPNTVSARAISNTVSGQYDCNAIEPIPLTPEILEKAGLKDVWIKNSWKVVQDICDGETFGWGMKVRNASYNKEIEFAYFKFLHQLQNLYFALTGEELIVKF